MNQHENDPMARLALAYNLAKVAIARLDGGRLEAHMTNFLREIYNIENAKIKPKITIRIIKIINNFIIQFFNFL